MVKELRNQLKGQTLGAVAPSAFKQVGSSVFPDAPSAQDLAAFREIVQSFQAVHLPTLGLPIPQSTVLTNVTLTTSDNEVTVVTAGQNEVIEILGIGVKTPSDYETGGITLLISKEGDSQPIMNYSMFDSASQETGQPMVYGKMIIAGGSNPNSSNPFVALSPLYINGGDTLLIRANNIPNDDIVFPVSYRKVVQ